MRWHRQRGEGPLLRWGRRHGRALEGATGGPAKCCRPEERTRDHMTKCAICNSETASPKTIPVRMTAITAGEDLRMETNEAHLRALDMAVHLLGHINAFRALSEVPDYLGRRRARYAMTLIMLDELASLMELMKECERAVTERSPEVLVKGFFSPEHKQERAQRALDEIGKSEALFLKVKRTLGREPSAIDFALFKDRLRQMDGNVFSTVERALRYDWSLGGDSLPSDEEIDMLFMAIELNVRGAAEFAYQWAMANEFDIDFRLTTVNSKDGCDGRKERGYWVTMPL